MENRTKKCSLIEHKETYAIIFCVECKIYMCNKCETFHSKLFPRHDTYNSDTDINDIFTGFCKEKEHHDKLEYFCKTHNQLCCAACIAKIKINENGKHKDCNVCIIDEIKEEKKNKITENINYFKDISNTLQKSIDEIKTIMEKINENKEKIKLQIQNLFTKIRNELNNREDKLLLEVDEKFNKLYFNENIVKDSEKLPEKIKLLLENVESINKEYNDNKISSYINNCIKVENNIKYIIEINENIKKCNNSVCKNIYFVPKDEETIQQFLENIIKFGKIECNEFKEINNSWTSERFNYSNCFYYTLKENNYIAEKTKNDNYIHLIKSSYQFNKKKIYKLEFITNYSYGGDFDIGFADFTESNSQPWLRSTNNCVGITNEGLYINGNKKGNFKIENGKKYEFIIDIEKQNFILNINEIKVGEFNFNFQDNIYAHAAIRKIGNSVTIKTYEN